MTTSPNPFRARARSCAKTGVLRNLRLKITPPNQFNDPFELAPRMEDELSREKAFDALTEPRVLAITYRQMVASGQFAGSFEEFSRAIQERSELLAGGLIEGYPESAAEFRHTHVHTVSTEFGLLCLSEPPDDILMWSHYTRHHKGLVIGFESAHAFFFQSAITRCCLQQGAGVNGTVR
jgi:hypothetical protein